MVSDCAIVNISLNAGIWCTAADFLQAHSHLSRVLFCWQGNQFELRVAQLGPCCKWLMFSLTGHSVATVQHLTTICYLFRKDRTRMSYFNTCSLESCSRASIHREIPSQHWTSSIYTFINRIVGLSMARIFLLLLSPSLITSRFAPSVALCVNVLSIVFWLGSHY